MKKAIKIITLILLISLTFSTNIFAKETRNQTENNNYTALLESLETPTESDSTQRKNTVTINPVEKSNIPSASELARKDLKIMQLLGIFFTIFILSFFLA